MSTEPNRPRKIRRTPEQIHEILKAYRASGQTRHRFAQEHGVGLSTLGPHRAMMPDPAHRWTG
jgi:hypothetical protein